MVSLFSMLDGNGDLDQACDLRISILATVVLLIISGPAV